MIDPDTPTYLYVITVINRARDAVFETIYTQYTSKQINTVFCILMLLLLS